MCPFTPHHQWLHAPFPSILTNICCHLLLSVLPLLTMVEKSQSSFNLPFPDGQASWILLSVSQPFVMHLLRTLWLVLHLILNWVVFLLLGCLSSLCITLVKHFSPILEVVALLEEWCSLWCRSFLTSWAPIYNCLSSYLCCWCCSETPFLSQWVQLISYFLFCQIRSIRPYVEVLYPTWIKCRTE